MKKKIAYLLKMFPRLSETFIMEEVLELERQGLDIHIISIETPADFKLPSMLSNLRAKVDYLPSLALKRYPAIFILQLKLIFKYPKGYLKTIFYVLTRSNSTAIRRFFQAAEVIPYLQQNGITHIHAHFADTATRMAQFIHMLTGKTYSFTAHARDLYADDELRSNRMKIKIRKARFVVTISNFNKKQIENAGYKVKSKKIFKIYNGISLEKYPLSKYPLESCTKIRILSVGRLVEKKGFTDLIQACRLLVDKGYIFHCTIIGSGPLFDDLSELISQLKLQNTVFLVGAKPHDKIIQKYYPRTSLFVLPCIVAKDGDQDGIPTVLLEAMAMGIPVISTLISGIPEVISDQETGLLVPSGDVKQLVLAMEQLICQPDLRRNIHQKAPAFIRQNFNIRENVGQLKDCFLKALKV